MSSQKKIRVIIPLLSCIFIFIFLWKSLKPISTELPSPLISQPAPFFHLPDLLNANQWTDNNDFIGHVTSLNIWATWCTACANEHAFLLDIANSGEVRIIGINYKDDPILAKQWLKNYGNPYHTVAMDLSGDTSIDWGVYGTPESFLIDKKGIIRYKQIGPIYEEAWNKTLHPLIMQLRNEV